MKKYGFWNFIFDLFMVLLTGGLWFVWMLFKALRTK